MTVSELIAELTKLDPSAEVRTEQGLEFYQVVSEQRDDQQVVFLLYHL